MALRVWWAHVNEVEVREADDLYVCNEVLVATLDRVIVDAPVIVEVKTTSQRVHDVERYWWWQAQAQLACTGYEHVEFAVLDASMTLQGFTVMPDTNAMRDIVDAAGMFLERLADGVEFIDAKPTPPDARELDANGRRLIHAWRILAAHADEIDGAIKRYKGMLDHALGDADSGTINGTEVVRRMYRTTRERDRHRALAQGTTRGCGRVHQATVNKYVCGSPMTAHEYTFGSNPMRVHYAVAFGQAVCNRPGAYRVTCDPAQVTCITCKRMARWGDVPIYDDQRRGTSDPNGAR